tara:strand:- start:412 stop:1215 length:804 start_codon:yes stop_codon:yes gene_type:complete
MRILFLGDIVGSSGCEALKKNLQEIKLKKQIDFVIVNGENAAEEGVGITEKICIEMFDCGVDVITTGNHVWDQKEILSFITNDKRLLRPENLIKPSPGYGFQIFENNGFKIGILNLMGNIFMKKCDDVFIEIENFINKNSLKKNYDFLVVDFHGEITSEKMAVGHLFDGKATLVVGTHTHVPTNDARILTKGTGYQTDAGMCGDYDSVIGMDKSNALKKFFKKDSKKHFPASGEASLCGVIVQANKKSGLAEKIENFIQGGDLKNSN